MKTPARKPGPQKSRRQAPPKAPPKAPKNQPVWPATARLPKYPRLSGNARADVCVVGAGIAGLTTAYLLRRAGLSVVVLEDGELATGMTGATTAHLATAIDDRYFRIAGWHGEDGARLTAESHSAAIDRVEEIVRRERIACDFERVDGYLFAPPDGDREILDRELEAAHRAGLVDVVRVARAPLEAFDTGACLLFPRQAQFHPLRYLGGLARALERLGGRIHTNTHADRIEGGSRARVTAGRRVVECGAVVVATNVPVNDLVAIHTKQAPYMTYVIAAPVPRGSVPRALYWDTSDPYHYVRLQPAKRAGSPDLLIVGGEDHKSGQADDIGERHARLAAWARERFPDLGDVAFTWGGQVMETIDGLAFIGRNPLDHDNVFVVTGDSGQGMTHGTIAGMLLTDLVRGQENPWAKLYDPSRKTLRAAGAFARENLNVAAQYADWLTAGDVESTREIERDSGAVVRDGLAKVAVYRDPEGRLHRLSAVCPHLGCIVAWNPAEKSWDCPCHGSRFDPRGHVFNGPANRDLAPASD